MDTNPEALKLFANGMMQVPTIIFMRHMMSAPPKTPKQSRLSKQEQEELIKSWAKGLQELDDWISASGFTVKDLEPSDTTQYVVTFPQGVSTYWKHPEQWLQDLTQKQGSAHGAEYVPPNTTPLVPRLPADLEDIAFEILRQARYRYKSR